MTMGTKKEIFLEYLQEYLKAIKKRKGKILDHVCFVAKMHRNSAVRKFKALQMRDPDKEERRGRATIYTPDVTAALKDVWKASGMVCGELLFPMIGEYITIGLRDKMWAHNQTVTAKLLQMSQATIKRRVREFNRKEKRGKGISATRPSKLKIIVPIFSGPWEDKPPGYGQIDTVVHCGHTLLGDYAYTLNYTDAALLWSRQRAQWNKGQTATKESMAYIKGKLPFSWRGAHPDTGSEFINNEVIGYCQENDIELSRSRPNHKNDNMYVEERNGHVVRKHVGYQRLDCHEAVDVLNELYDVLDLFLNHFVPVRKCVKKERVGARYKRVYEKLAKTPYQRLQEHPAIVDEIKKSLKAIHGKLNPFVLQKEILRLQNKINNTQKRFGKPKN
jgi:hypothetical protein